MHHGFIAANLRLPVAKLLVPFLRFLGLQVIFFAVLQQNTFVHQPLQRHRHVLAQLRPVVRQVAHQQIPQHLRRRPHAAVRARRAGQLANQKDQTAESRRQPVLLADGFLQFPQQHALLHHAGL